MRFDLAEAKSSKLSGLPHRLNAGTLSKCACQLSQFQRSHANHRKQVIRNESAVNPRSEEQKRQSAAHQKWPIGGTP
jgi:hypothetical protein